VFARYRNGVAVKARHSAALQADSVLLCPSDSCSRFTLGTDDKNFRGGIYSGDLRCIPDMATLLFINTCDIESYVAGVVRAEGGNGKRAEYFRTQAIIARTYTYRHFNRHALDRYNLCDDTHCQVYNGLSYDSLINRAVEDTRGTVIVSPDSNLIISAFHSNCGGETSPSGYAWGSSEPYLVEVKDPYCLKSRNSTWTREITLDRWVAMLKKNGYSGRTDSSAVFESVQPGRTQNYLVGKFSVPFTTIRKDLDLRSAWFSVFGEGDTIRLEGRGYGHGVGLCQEGAMVMASRGMTCLQIISFYYPGVRLLKIADAKKSHEENTGSGIRQGN